MNALGWSQTMNLYLIIRYKSIIYKFCKLSSRDCSRHFLCERARTPFAAGPPPIGVYPPPDCFSFVKSQEYKRLTLIGDLSWLVGNGSPLHTFI